MARRSNITLDLTDEEAGRGPRVEDIAYQLALAEKTGHCMRAKEGRGAVEGVHEELFRCVNGECDGEICISRSDGLFPENLGIAGTLLGTNWNITIAMRDIPCDGKPHDIDVFLKTRIPFLPHPEVLH